MRTPALKLSQLHFFIALAFFLNLLVLASCSSEDEPALTDEMAQDDSENQNEDSTDDNTKK